VQSKNTAVRLPACDKWHPDEPTEMVTNYHFRADRLARVLRRRCLVCDRRRRLTYNIRNISPKVGAPYGVIPLNWKPPVWDPPWWDESLFNVS
jgi:hypothetical protein